MQYQNYELSIGCKGGTVLIVVVAEAFAFFLHCLWEQEAHLKRDRKCLGASLPVYQVCPRRE